MSWGYSNAKTYVQNYGTDALVRDLEAVDESDVAEILRATSNGETEYSVIFSGKAKRLFLAKATSNLLD